MSELGNTLGQHTNYYNRFFDVHHIECDAYEGE